MPKKHSYINIPVKKETRKRLWNYKLRIQAQRGQNVTWDSFLLELCNHLNVIKFATHITAEELIEIIDIVRISKKPRLYPKLNSIYHGIIADWKCSCCGGIIFEDELDTDIKGNFIHRDCKKGGELWKK